MAENLFELRNVSKKHVRGGEELVIFSGLNMNIHPGDFIAIMGPSGSGKTTLLNLLGGIDQPSSGEIHFHGKRMDNLGENALAAWRGRHIGFIFQFYNLMPMLSAAENIELPLLLTTMSKSERKERVESALKLVQLENRALRRSGAQQDAGRAVGVTPGTRFGVRDRAALAKPELLNYRNVVPSAARDLLHRWKTETSLCSG
jgi:ABC-type lipoprotein export system ATPase subunit